MDKYKGLAQNIGLFTISNFATKLISFVLVPLYTFYLTQSDFGITDMTNTVIMLATPIVTASISDAVLRFMIDDKRNSHLYAAVGTAITAISFVIVLIFLPVLHLPMFGGLDKWASWFYICCCISIMQTYLSNVARGLNETKQMAFASLCSSAVTGISAGIFIAWLRLGLRGYFLSTLLGGIAGCLWYLAVKSIRACIHLPQRKAWTLLRPMLVYALPLIPNALFWWINQSVNRFFITAQLGIAATGLFAAASKIPSLLNVLQTIFQQAWNLSAFQQYRNDGRESFFNVTFRLYSFVLSVGTGLLILFTPVLSGILLKKSFHKAWVFVPILMLSFLYSSMAAFMGTVYTASLKTKSLFTTTVIGAILCLSLTWALIRPLGITGACVASLASNVVVFILRIFSSRKILRVDIKPVLLIIEAVLLGAMTVLELKGTTGVIANIVIFFILTVVECLSSRSEIAAIRGESKR